MRCAAGQPMTMREVIVAGRCASGERHRTVTGGSDPAPAAARIGLVAALAIRPAKGGTNPVPLLANYLQHRLPVAHRRPVSNCWPPSRVTARRRALPHFGAARQGRATAVPEFRAVRPRSDDEQVVELEQQLDRGRRSVSPDVGGGAGRRPGERLAALLFSGKENRTNDTNGSVTSRLLLRKVRPAAPANPSI